MDELKEAFKRVKKEINFLKKEVFEVKSLFVELGNTLYNLDQKISQLEKKGKNQTEGRPFQTNKIKNQTEIIGFKSEKDQNLGISIGNRGVQTDRQTNKQTKFFKKREIQPENRFWRRRLFSKMQLKC